MGAPGEAKPPSSSTQVPSFPCALVENDLQSKEKELQDFPALLMLSYLVVLALQILSLTSGMAEL